MQTSEYRHLKKRAKKALDNPGNRRHLKRACAELGKVLGPDRSEAGKRREEDCALRGDICRRLRRRKKAAAAA